MIDAVFKTWSGDDLNIGVFWHGIKTKACIYFKMDASDFIFVVQHSMVWDDPSTGHLQEWKLNGAF
jgi:hypothetical protein